MEFVRAKHDEILNKRGLGNGQNPNASHIGQSAAEPTKLTRVLRLPNPSPDTVYNQKPTNSVNYKKPTKPEECNVQ